MNLKSSTNPGENEREVSGLSHDNDDHVECFPIFGETWFGEKTIDETGSEIPPGFSDCDDTEISIFPNAPELCDAN